MDKKEIKNAVRFANRVHDSFVAPEISMAPVYRTLKAMERCIRRMERRTRYGDVPGPRSMRWRSFQDPAVNVRSQMNSWMDEPWEVFQRLRPLDFRSGVLSVLALIREEGGEIELSEDVIKLVIPVSDFCLPDTNGEEHLFEDLKIEFSTEGGEFQVAVIGPEFENQGYCHPHIDHKAGICEGAAEVGIQNALTSCNVLAAFDLIIALLHTYNPSSPFFSLEDINGESCSDCGEITSEPNTCAACEAILCSDCYHTCGACGEILCSGCYHACSACGEILCVNCRYGCSACGTMVCESHINVCVNCDDDVCDDCLYRCADCEKTLCNDCSHRCADCGNPLCSNCADFCDSCNKTLCEDCKEANHHDCEE